MSFFLSLLVADSSWFFSEQREKMKEKEKEACITVNHKKDLKGKDKELFPCAKNNDFFGQKKTKVRDSATFFNRRLCRCRHASNYKTLRYEYNNICSFSFASKEIIHYF